VKAALISVTDQKYQDLLNRIGGISSDSKECMGFLGDRPLFLLID
jgi:hypothetical protein